MDLQQKLTILSEAAKYDASCSSSGSTRKNSSSGLGNGARGGICHSWSDDGRCISLLKILFTNYCIYDCVYCVNRVSNDIPRASFTPREVAELTVNFYKRNYIEGLFLSSAVSNNPDYTMEQILEAVSLLRNEYNFNGYIHIKAIPGADFSLINRAGQLVDRMSVNIELPSRTSLKSLAPQKKPDNILKPMKKIGDGISQNKEEKKKYKKAKNFVPAGQSTQLIVGASPEPDYQILKLSEGLYNKFNLRRVYYSAYIPVNNNKQLPGLKRPPLLREHRLYQADWLLRFYKFKADELLDEEKKNFDIELDPKANWALNNIELFPIEINQAGYDMLIRVPGIGPKSARRIISSRQKKNLGYYDLKQLGSVLKRARYFITCKGKYYAGIPFDRNLIRDRLVSGSGKTKNWNQLSIFHDKNDSEVTNNLIEVESTDSVKLEGKKAESSNLLSVNTDEKNGLKEFNT